MAVPTAPATEPQTIPELFAWRVRLTPAREAYRYWDPGSSSWVSVSWAQMEARARAWSRALQQEGLTSGARVGLLVPNGIEHVCMDQAALRLGHVSVPLHVIDNPESLAFVIADSGLELLLVDTHERWQALVPLRDRFPALKRVVYLTDAGSAPETGMARSLAYWVSDSVEAPPVRDPPAIVPETLAAIVYTSGTTGRPKGVMLSHSNILSNVRALRSVMPVEESDLFLSFLPLSHTLERTVGYYLPIAAGAAVAFSRSVPLLMQDLAVVAPTVLVSVPRIYERVYAALQEAAKPSAVKRRLLALAVALGWQAFEHQQGRGPAPGWLVRLASRVLRTMIAKPLQARFGGRLRAAVTGGAAMPFEVGRALLGLGIPILQGYGMTESSPVVTCNVPDDNDPATVGRVLPGVSVRIGDRDELLVKGPNVMLGYWQRSEETTRVVDPNGWLHTGDQAQVQDGRVRIRGRLKDIIVTSTGEKISPGDLESAIAGDPVFEQVMVLGEKRPYLVALLVLNQQRWSEQARLLGLDPTSTSGLKTAAATGWAVERVRELARAFPVYATPKAVLLLTEPWTIAAGLMTPTLKPKRAAIEARFAAEINALYQGH